jgi:nitric oxide reductase subunit B
MNKDFSLNSVLKWLLLIVVVACVAALIFGTKKTYDDAPPIPAKIVSTTNQVVMTSSDIIAGKAGFQQADLMDYGSLFGMGSSFGIDYTAQYLHQLGLLVKNSLAKEKYNTTYENLSKENQAAIDYTVSYDLHNLQLNSKRLIIDSNIADAINTLRDDISTSLLKTKEYTGYTKAYSLNQQTSIYTADFLIYSALVTVINRPNQNYSYTNNWPYDPSVGNIATTATFMWTWISFALFILGIGGVLFIYQQYLKPAEEHNESLPSHLFEFNPLLASQKSIAPYFLIVAIVLLVQILVGAILGHYYTDRSSFYGIDLLHILPFNFLRDVHIQTPIVWIGLSWIGGALFLSPIIGKTEATYQNKLVIFLFWVTLLIVAGALIGDYLGIKGVISKNWFWLGNQGLSYLQLGRVWQIGFFIGLVLWSILVFRGFWPVRDKMAETFKNLFSGKITLEHLLWISTFNIAILYCFGMIPLTGIEKSFTITDFWRWWVVHLWVEESFEFFTVCGTAYLLMGCGLVSRTLAERTVYFEATLVFFAGVLGTGHHYYWAGESSIWIALGSTFSFLEVLPLVLLVNEGLEQYNIIWKEKQTFPYKVAFMFILGSAAWNFIGAGVMGGGALNAPLINYYEHGTFLTFNHAHTALFGAFGLFALGVIYFCLRYAAGNKFAWSDKLGIWSFWLYNLGLILWIVLNLIPVGYLQLIDVYNMGYWHARTMDFYNTVVMWQWLRVPGDIIFAVAALIMVYDFIIKLKPFYQK